MSHELDMQNGRASIAYAGDTPWHGLGQKIDANAPLEVWREQAGMNFELLEAPVMFELDAGSSNAPVEDRIITFPERKVLYRSDTGKPLAAVSAKYKVVQPNEVLEFYRELIETADFEMQTAGVLFGGKKYWALARTGEAAKIKANSFEQFLLLATACDGSMSTVAQFTGVEVVCNNTLTHAVQMADGKTKGRLSIPHNAVFNGEKVKAELGLSHNSWEKYIEEVRLLADRTINRAETVQWLIDTFGNPEVAIEDQLGGPAALMKTVYELFTKTGVGHNLEGRKGTLLGLVSATTEYYDYHTGHRTVDGRFDKAQFGESAAMKQKAWDNALLIAA